MARGGRALRRHRKRSDAFDGRLDAPPEVSVTRSAQRRPRAPHRRCDFGESARSAAEALGATAVDAVNGPSRSGPRAAPSGDSRGHAGVSMASSLSISLARCVLALDRSARPLPSRAAARAARPAAGRRAGPDSSRLSSRSDLECGACARLWQQPCPMPRARSARAARRGWGVLVLDVGRPRRRRGPHRSTGAGGCLTAWLACRRPRAACRTRSACRGVQMQAGLGAVRRGRRGAARRGAGGAARTHTRV